MNCDFGISHSTWFWVGDYNLLKDDLSEDPYYDLWLLMLASLDFNDN